MTTLLFGIDDTNPALDPTTHSPEWKHLDGLLASYPQLKITHFIPAQYSMPSGLAWGIQKRVRKTLGMDLGITPNEQSNLIHFREWCSFFTSHSQYEAGMHGLYHVNVHDGSAQEFVGLTLDETRRRMEQAQTIFREAGLGNPRTFGPPGWGITPELLQIVKEKKLTFAGNLARFNQDESAGWTTPGVYHAEHVNGILNVPRNISIERFDPVLIQHLLAKDAIISLHAHFRNIGVRNGITAETIEHARKTIEAVEKQKKITFAFFGEVSGP